MYVTTNSNTTITGDQTAMFSCFVHNLTQTHSDPSSPFTFRSFSFYLLKTCRTKFVGIPSIQVSKLQDTFLPPHKSIPAHLRLKIQESLLPCNKYTVYPTPPFQFMQILLLQQFEVFLNPFSNTISHFSNAARSLTILSTSPVVNVTFELLLAPKIH